MPRLPQPGGDAGNWGQILNDYLSVEHNGDGTLKNVARPGDVSSKYTKPGSGIPKSDLEQPVQDTLDTVATHTTDIAGKASQTDLTATNTRIDGSLKADGTLKDQIVTRGALAADVAAVTTALNEGTIANGTPSGSVATATPTLGSPGNTEGAVHFSTLGPYRFTHGISSTTFNGVRDDVLHHGYNLGDDFGPANNGEVSLIHTMESHYLANDGNHYTEWNLNWFGLEGIYKRFMALLINRVTNLAIWAFAGTQFRIEHEMNGNQFMFEPGTSPKHVHFRLAGGSQEMLQIGGDSGDGSSAPDYISLAPYALNNWDGVSMHKSGGVGLGLQAPETKQVSVGPPVYLKNNTAPATPNGGGVLYVEDGVLKYIGSSGTVTVLGPA